MAIILLFELVILLIGTQVATNLEYEPREHWGVPTLLQNIWNDGFQSIALSKYPDLAAPSANARIFMWRAFVGFSALNFILAALYDVYVVRHATEMDRDKSGRLWIFSIAAGSSIVIFAATFTLKDYIGVGGGGSFLGNARKGWWVIVFPFGLSILLASTFYIAFVIVDTIWGRNGTNLRDKQL